MSGGDLEAMASIQGQNESIEPVSIHSPIFGRHEAVFPNLAAIRPRYNQGYNPGAFPGIRTPSMLPAGQVPFGVVGMDAASFEQARPRNQREHVSLQTNDPVLNDTDSQNGNTPYQQYVVPTNHVDSHFMSQDVHSEDLRGIGGFDTAPVSTYDYRAIIASTQDADIVLEPEWSTYQPSQQSQAQSFFDPSYHPEVVPTAPPGFVPIDPVLEAPLSDRPWVPYARAEQMPAAPQYESYDLYVREGSINVLHRGYGSSSVFAQSTTSATSSHRHPDIQSSDVQGSQAMTRRYDGPWGVDSVDEGEGSAARSV